MVSPVGGGNKYGREQKHGIVGCRLAIEDAEPFYDRGLTFGVVLLSLTSQMFLPHQQQYWLFLASMCTV